MIVWLNGAFGVGKSSVAMALRDRWPRVGEFNPELIGWLLQRTWGLLSPGDYQHLRAWRWSTAASIRWWQRWYEPVVVPMSVLRLRYLDQMLGGLRARNTTVHHVLLDATEETLRERISNDVEHRSAQHWRSIHIDQYLAVREQLRSCAHVVATDGRSPEQVADAVVAILDEV